MWSVWAFHTSALGVWGKTGSDVYGGQGRSAVWRYRTCVSVRYGLAVEMKVSALGKWSLFCKRAFIYRSNFLSTDQRENVPEKYVKIWLSGASWKLTAYGMEAGHRVAGSVCLTDRQKYRTVFVCVSCFTLRRLMDHVTWSCRDRSCVPVEP